MRARLAIVVSALALVVPAQAEIVEEETWYNAKGKVVKTVKRTLTGADARREPDWEPAWVRRESARDPRRAGRHSWHRRSYGGYAYGGSSLFTHGGARYYSPRRSVCRGFGGFVRAGGGGARWGASYCGSGVRLFIGR